MTWAIVPAAGRGRRFGGDVPKQYLVLAGRSILEHSLRAMLACDAVEGVVVALAADDAMWPGWDTLDGKPVRTCVGGDERADSVLAGLDGLPDSVAADDPVLVHDAARPCLAADDIVASMVMKPVGGGVHWKRGTVHHGLVKWLELGSVPTAFIGVFL